MEQETKNWKKLALISIIMISLMILLLVGAMFNNIAVESNGGKMPVQSSHYTNYETSTHYYYQYASEVNNYLLTDIFRIRNMMYSIGDFLMYVCFFVFIIYGILFVNQVNNIKKFEMNKNSKKQRFK